MSLSIVTYAGTFYDNSILSGTKIYALCYRTYQSFTITQFFQVLKLLEQKHILNIGFTITQFFQVLK